MAIRIRVCGYVRICIRVCGCMRICIRVCGYMRICIRVCRLMNTRVQAQAKGMAVWRKGVPPTAPFDILDISVSPSGRPGAAVPLDRLSYAADDAGVRAGTRAVRHARAGMAAAEELTLTLSVANDGPACRIRVYVPPRGTHVAVPAAALS